MNLVSKLLEDMEAIHVFYIVGLLIFVGLFIIIFIRTMRRPAREMQEIKESILDETDPEDNHEIKN